MKLAHSIRIGICVLIGINLLMAFCCIWVFLRMAPAIDQIILRNANSLRAGRHMLTALTFPPGKENDPEPQAEFEKALEAALGNITESNEPECLDEISANYQAAFNGDSTARLSTIKAIDQLCETNMQAMTKADQEARHLGISGAWGVVFMAAFVFLVGLLVARFLIRRIITPLEEIYSALECRRHGDAFRRCSLGDTSGEMFRILTDINDVLEEKFLEPLKTDDLSFTDQNDNHSNNAGVVTESISAKTSRNSSRI